MSYSKRTQVSAYQMYSKSSRQSQSYSSDNSHNNHGGRLLEKTSSGIGSRDSQRHREKSYDSDEEVLKGYVPKSLASSVSKDHSSEKQRMLEPSKRRETAHGKHFDNDKKAAKSLMEIDFSTDRNVSRSSLSKWKDISSHHGISSGEESHEHLGEQRDWRSGKKYSKYSDSEEDGDAWHSTSKSRRTWKNSSTLAQGSGYSSQSAALIVDMADRSNKSVRRQLSGDNNSKPKPLLETYIPPLTKKPVSLMDLPNVGNRGDSRYQRKSSHRSDFSGTERKLSSYTRSDQGAKSSASSRKRTSSVDHQELPSKKSKVVKPKSESKVAVVDSSKITVCKTSGHTFLIIPSILTPLYLHGKAKVTVLMGSISILGYKLRIGSTYDVYSPSSGSLLAMQAGDGTKFKTSEVKEELSKFNISENDKDLENIGNNTIAVLKIDKHESAVCDYVTSFIPYTQLFTAVPSRDLEASELKGVTLSKLGLKVSPMNEMVSPCMHISQDYEDVLVKWTKRLSGDVEGNKLPVLLCCGAKNVGKSTFNRMLINTALKSVSAVAYLECDVGQTEFSPPATMSLHVLKQPVLEPPFCHQRQAEKMVFYGETSPSYDPSFYIQCLKFIVEAFHELNPKLPLIVNTMGFPEGVGVMLLIDTVHLVKPDLVVQIKSFSHAANLPPMTHEFVALEEGWTFNKTAAKDPKLKMADTHQHELVLLPTLVSQRRDFSFKLKPVDLRNLTLLSALSAHLEKGMTLTSLPPYTVPYKQFGIYVCHHRLSDEEMLAAVDASVVALCVADLSKAERKREDLPFVFPDMPVCTCLGLGIVRGVDVSKGLLYLVTTLPRMYLQSVNTILKGSLSLPDQMFLKQAGPAHIPYVDALAPSTAVASVRPRSRMPRVTLGANK